MRLGRLLGIVIQLLSTEKLITATELSEKFEVSIRTIYRDIDLISQAGVPISSHVGIEGGFQIMDNFTLNKQAFTLDDLSVVYQLLEEFGTSHFKSISEKLAVIQPMVKKKDNQILISMSNSENERSIIKLWLDAINQNKVISMNYTDAEGNISCREIEPRNLLLKGTKWYVEGYCLNKQAERMFLLSRINEIAMLDKYFEVRERVYSEPSQQTTIYLHLRFSKDIKQRVIEQFEDVRIHSDHIDVHTTIYDRDYAVSLALSYGSKVKIIAPIEIRNAFLKELKKINHVYFRGENLL
ncbi:helix-turn-helix transcriptional regulator [Gracilibacillus alcaliphilus]|uniref:helix-turn-helix transcriptional regulator n=1 Tax=Gracilibacillus alcaliphilus TaxID=1401441 RepID=UPI00195A0F08|nr:YafY family protein [Gracilibacillus alcaliphilus]MBM7678837.1 putative DNA-binding transcriptional regulator YafY [Gracilibacillus alcaliphilus]